ncbi:N-acetylglucosamine kinase-like BadF-type ATPase [Sedimentibacter acidaminivorans]|uniref:N-acetylglucosamine kinase-like BadF-type ATPase n=1 Tax=Sedimentibacter acidaminivorans TaxID=913099 RepID=A0ABS4GG28_9FIRM|nr:BadF/BadG/BcrA/BcrD ATPase family protein [Sedimentibacter acidaminivorans]MBP1926636.1 N-acetylglucosamine kinase-like BadF-type ATPase [Sedimentibacter acidaminivorans]
MEYLIGIDAGGTKSELIAYDLEFNPIYFNVGGFGNPSIDLDTAIKNISVLIDKCLQEHGDNKCIFIAAGIAGVGTGNYKNVVESYINNTYSIDNVILNDAEMAAKAYLGNGDGIVSIAGTGASVYVQKDNLGEVIGGWGHILGDKGSGYHTVIEAFIRITDQIDNNNNFDNLSIELLKAIGAKNASDVKKFIYNNQKNKIGALFPKIVELSKIGDEIAIKLLQNAGKYLADSTIIASRKFGGDSKVVIGLKGGVFYNSEIVISSYESAVSEHIMNCKFIDKDIPVTLAVCNIYKTRR